MPDKDEVGWSALDPHHAGQLVIAAGTSGHDQ